MFIKLLCKPCKKLPVPLLPLLLLLLIPGFLHFGAIQKGSFHPSSTTGDLQVLATSCVLRVIRTTGVLRAIFTPGVFRTVTFWRFTTHFEQKSRS